MSSPLEAVLTACGHAGRSGKEFSTLLAVAYQVESALTSNALFMADGFDLATERSWSIADSACRALQLDEARSAEAVEICGDSRSCGRHLTDLLRISWIISTSPTGNRQPFGSLAPARILVRMRDIAPL
jgi:hypothetical protein